MSNVEIIATSRNLSLEKLEVGKSDRNGVVTSPKSGDVASSGVKNKKAKPQILPENASFSPVLKKLVASNPYDQTGSSVSKPPSKKKAARKTLGSRPKVSKKTEDNQKCSLFENFSVANVDLHLADQIEEKDQVNSSVIGKILPPRTKDVSTALEAKTLNVNDAAKPIDDETSGIEVTNLSLDNTDQQELPDANLKGIEHDNKFLALEKGISRRAKETLIVEPKEVVQDSIVVGGEAGSTGKATKFLQIDPGVIMAVSVRNLASNKRRKPLQLNKSDTLVDMEMDTESNHDKDGQRDGDKQGGEELLGTLNSTKVLTEIENENDLKLGNDRRGTNGVKQTGKKRRGTLRLNKSNTPVEVEKEIESAPDKSGQHDGDRQSEKLSGKSNSAKVLTEIGNENDTIVGDGRCTNKGVKQIGKKRRGTLLLSKPEERTSEDKENLPVDGKRSTDTVIGDDQDADKGKKKKRRGTLGLSKAKETVELEKGN